MTYNYTDEQILAAAKAGHECNRAFCVAVGDNSQVTWEWAEQWQRDSAVAGVQGVINGNTPEQQHGAWSQFKLNDGWKYGPVKDAAKKEHPCLVAYNDLSFEQRAKDVVYVTVVRNVLDSLRTMEETLPGV